MIVRGCHMVRSWLNKTDDCERGGSWLNKSGDCDRMPYDYKLIKWDWW